jgi:hypothetical protein
VPREQQVTAASNSTAQHITSPFTFQLCEYDKQAYVWISLELV